MSGTPAELTVVIWTFNGRVLPDLPEISLNIPRHRATSLLGFEYELEGHIYRSKILATVRQTNPVDILTMRNAVAMDIQGAVDLAGFLCGAGLEVDLISAKADDGSWHFFDAFIPFLRNVGEIEIPTAQVAAVAADVPSQIALADFRRAMRQPEQTGFYCYRAIEALMQSIRQSPDQKDGPAWELLREHLQVSRVALDRVKVHADWARHGKPGKVSDAERVKLLGTTQKIIDRYLQYLLGGRVPLDQSKHSVLD